ncbi:MAG: hypothetical protein MR528_02115 [Lachnospiraceae bacterium]|nr:hypothetical protein [Lachnospiraceae bacterium]
MKEKGKKLTFRGGVLFSLVPVVIYVFFCVILFIGFKAFNMEALAVGGFLALLIGGLSGGFVWMANSMGIHGGLFVAFTFLATCIVSTATGSFIGTMFIAFPIFTPQV